MNQISKWRTQIVRICLGCCVAIAIFAYGRAIETSPVSAQSNLINSDIISLRSRVSRLEQEINQLRYSVRADSSPPAKKLPIPDRSAPTSRPTVVNPPIVNGQAVGKSDPMYERLATLLVELKEDVKNINQRLTQIEQQVEP